MNKWQRIVIIACCSLAPLAAIFICGSDRTLNGPLAYSSAFTGLLTLTGFILTARTFIVFKLNETVYGTDAYRDLVKDFTEQGALKKSLYEPLKQLDEILGRTSLFCFSSLLYMALFALIPKHIGAGASLWDRMVEANGATTEKFTAGHLLYQGAAWVAYTALDLSIVQGLWAVFRVNVNIKEIISKWEKDQDKRSKKRV